MKTSPSEGVRLGLLSIEDKGVILSKPFAMLPMGRWFSDLLDSKKPCEKSCKR
jgi:hypothetical protein